MPDHAGETEAYRRRFQSAAALILGYRAIGTMAAIAGFGASSPESPATATAVQLATGYVAFSVFACWFTGSAPVQVPRFGARTVGLGKGWWLDQRFFFQVDLLTAIALNLWLASTLPTGTAYAQFTDLFAVANITAVVLWTGRRGGRMGLRVVALVLLAEVAKGPVNGIGLNGVVWSVVMTRMIWVMAGWILAIGVVRILLSYAERIDRLRIDDEDLERLGRSHDIYKVALRRVADCLNEQVPDVAAGPWRGRFYASRSRIQPDGPSDLARRIALDALEPTYEQPVVSNSLEAVLVEAARKGRSTSPSMEFCIVDATHRPIALDDSRQLGAALNHLCMNAARHSKGTTTVVHSEVLNEDTVEITVRDDGVGMPTKEGNGHGLALLKRQVERFGGEAHLEPVKTGTKWVIRFPLPSPEGS